MKNICVFCGAQSGHDDKYVGAATTLGRILAGKHYRLVYGAGKVGMMGEVADALLMDGGEAIGVIPEFLVEKEVAHEGLTELIVVDTMHTRKQRMETISDGFIALPGGFGTMDELCEILTWAQLGLHDKPIGILNCGGYFDHLIAFFDQSVESGFLSAKNRSLLLVDDNPEKLLDAMEAYIAPAKEKWLDNTRI